MRADQTRALLVCVRVRCVRPAPHSAEQAWQVYRKTRRAQQMAEYEKTRAPRDRSKRSRPAQDRQRAEKRAEKRARRVQRHIAGQVKIL